MCGIWNWQSTIVEDLNDSQDPKHTYMQFCWEKAFVVICAFFSDNKCRPKRTLSVFFHRFFWRGLPLTGVIKDACCHADYEHLLLMLHAPLIHFSNGFQATSCHGKAGDES